MTAIGERPCGFFVLIMLNYENRNLENIQGEIWKPILGYEGLYEVSNYGRIKSLHRFVGYKINGKYRVVKQRILSQHLQNDYLHCILSKNNIKETPSVARTVAIAFLDNPQNKPTVNHKNRNKLDNSLSNLEWATHKEQTLHILEFGGRDTKRGEEHWKTKTVYQYDINGKLLNTYVSLVEAAKSVNRSVTTICDACIGKINSCAGYIWSYSKINELEFVGARIGNSTKPKPVIKKSLSGLIVGEYKNTKDAARENRHDASGIMNACLGNIKSYKGYIWEYKK